MERLFRDAIWMPCLHVFPGNGALPACKFSQPLRRDRGTPARRLAADLREDAVQRVLAREVLRPAHRDLGALDAP